MEIIISYIIIIILVTIAVMVLSYLKSRITSLFEQKFGFKNAKNISILKSLSDALKLLIKEDLAPNSRKKILYFLAPLIVFCPAIIAFALIPIVNKISIINTDVSAILFLALVSIPVIGAFFAGYSNNSYDTLTSSVRSIILTASFEIPLGISILAASFLAGSLNINNIILAQNGAAGLFSWYFIPQILGCIAFFICLLIITNCGPFNITESENQLISSYTTKYSGSKFALFCFSKYALLFLMSLFFVSIFFGGYLSPFGTYILPTFLVPFEQIFWFILKTFLVILCIFTVELTLPKLSYERILSFSYKVLLPLSIINLNISILIKYFINSNS